MVFKRGTSLVLLAAATAVTVFLVVLLPDGPFSQLTVFLLLWIWPAFAWAAFINGHLVERALFSTGLVFLLNSLLLYLYSLLAGEPSKTIYLLLAAASAFLPLLAISISGREIDITAEERKANWPALFIIFLISIGFRLINMGYKELQGDEGVILVRAASVLTGDGAELFIHQKGPIEILIPMAPWLAGGSINEFWARIPFVWAGLLAVAAIYWLGRSWFGENVGLLAALLFAINGFAIAFSRIIQYQSFVILFGALSLTAAWRYKKSGSRLSILFVAIFLAGGLLAHYDAVLFVPAVGWLLAERIKQEGRIDFWTWLPALFLGAVLVALFYVPFFAGPSFKSTFGYLLNDRIGSGSGIVSSWSGPEAWRMSTFYNSLWYILGIMLMLAAGLWQLIVRKSHFASVLYFLVPFLFYILLVADPRTHVYTFFPGAVILAALGTQTAWYSIKRYDRRYLTTAAAGLFIVWCLVSAFYPYLMLVDKTPERQRTWSENRPFPSLYPVTWDEPPQFGLFGFPHQAGWRAAAELVDDSFYPYASNEEEEITNWYMSQGERTYCSDFSSYIIAADAQDEIPFDPEIIAGLNLAGAITVNGREGINIYRSEEIDELPSIEAAERILWLTPQDAAPPTNAGSQIVDLELGELVRLLGYDLDVSDAKRGGRLKLTLYWEALSDLDRNFQVFVHLYDGQMRAQDDGAPECSMNPTTRWEPGQIIVDPHIIELPSNFPDHDIPILVGLYDLITKDRLEVPGSADDAITLQTLKIRNE